MIAAQAKDIHDAESEWKSIKVTINALDMELVKKVFGIGITAKVSNLDVHPFNENATVNFTMTNAVILIGKEKHAPLTVPISPEASVTIHSGFILGFGIGDIKASVWRDDERMLFAQITGRCLILGPFVFILS